MTTLLTKAGYPVRVGSIEDLSQAADLMRSSWRENVETEFDYDSDFLRSCLEYPADYGPVIAPAFYDGSDLVAIVLGLPRKAQVGGRVRRLLLTTSLTVAPQWKGHGLAVAIAAHCLERAQSSGYDGVIRYCAEGSVSNHVVLAASLKVGHHRQALPPVRFLRRLLTPAVRKPELRPSVDDFLRAAESVTRQTPLCRLWSEPEAEWQLWRRSGALAVTARTESGSGAITGYVMRTLDPLGTRCLIIDDILWDNLPFDQRASLLERFLSLASSMATIAIVPVLKYADMTAFHETGFRRAPRILQPYLTLFDGDYGLDVSSLPSMYIDVL